MRYIPAVTPFMIPNFKEVQMSFNEAVDRTILILDKTIKLFLINNQDIGVMLSGGLDSSVILARLKKLCPSRHIYALAMGFCQDNDELDNSAYVANHLGVEYSEIIVKDFLADLPRMIYETRLPKWNVYPYNLFKACSNVSKNWISGEGGDELFGGYTFRYEKFIQDNPIMPIDKVSTYLNTNIRDWVPDQDMMFGSKIHFNWKMIYDVLFPYFCNNNSTLNQVFLADYCGKLYNEFMVIDEACAKAVNINISSPMLTRNMISFSQTIPNKYKYNGLGKLILREILRRAGLDGNILFKTKHGFGPDVLSYWHKYSCKSRIESLLENSVLVKEGIINMEWINKHIDTNDIRYMNKFLIIVAMEVYFRLFVTKEMNPNERL